MRRVIRAAAVLLCAGLLLALSACADRTGVTDPDRPNAGWVATPPYTDVTVGSATFSMWPWTTSTLTLAAPDDPANILIVGEGDPRTVRAALMTLGPSPALGCTWSDAIGDEQAAAAAGVGWTGSAIQLACGPFGPEPRLHLRMFDIGDAVLGQAHFEVQIPGTSDHQVLSYEFAELVVLGELARTLLADPSTFTLTSAITPTTHRVIPALVFNELPDALQALVRGVPGDVTSDVPIPNGDGKLTIVPLAHYTGPSVGSSQAFTLMFNQGVPKPFCQAPGDWVYVTGPVALSMTVSIAPDGTLERYFRAQGRLSVTPIDVTVSPPMPIGVTYTANVTQDHQAWATETAHWVQAKLHQVLVPGSGPDRGMVNAHFRVGSAVPDDFTYRENCGALRP